MRMPSTELKNFPAMFASQCPSAVGPVHDWLQHVAGNARTLPVYAQRAVGWGGGLGLDAGSHRQRSTGV